MGRNRFKHSQSLHWAMVLKCIVISGFFLALGLSYVMYKNQVMKIADETEKQKKELARIVKRNEQIKLNISYLTSPQALQTKVAASGLVPVGEMLVIRRDLGTGASLARTYSPNLDQRPPR
jgi:hypothetical protein